MLVEVGRIRLRTDTVEAAIEDSRWVLDDPPASAWFRRALEIGWTRDPFDRLLVAHARLRGWRLATSDSEILRQLDSRQRIDL